MDRDRVKIARKKVRSAVTRTITLIETELNAAQPDQVELEVNLKMLESHMEKLLQLDDQMTEVMLDEACTEEEHDAESESVQEYCMKVERAKTKVNMKLGRASRSPSPTCSFQSASTGKDGKKSYKLPKIELKKFSGDLTEWLGWWSQFQKIDEDEDLHATDKFQYLTQCMVEGSRARQLVERYPQSAENYPKVVAALKERFGKEKLLRQVYIREMLKMVVNKCKDSSGKWSLSMLYDKWDSHVRSLESLGAVEDPKEFLFPMMESSLPEDILVAWQRSPYYGKDGTKENPVKTELDFLMDFIKQEIDGEEQRVLAKAGFGLPVNEKKSTLKKKVYFEEDEPTAAGLFSGNGGRLACVFCDKPHHSQKCFKAASLGMEIKKQILNKKKACFKCFGYGHLSRDCRSSVKCVTCGRENHHAIMCHEDKKKVLDATVKEFTPTTASHLNCTHEVYLQTLMVKIRNQKSGKDVRVRVLIDNGSQRSYIKKKTSDELGLRPIDKLTLHHALFGGSHIVGKEHNLFNVGLFSTYGDFSTSMNLMDQEPRICDVIPRVQKGPWMRELKSKKIRLNDLEEENPMEIEILLGADNLPSILTGKIMHLSNGLMATETRFGWTLMGQLEPKDQSLTMNVITMNVTSANVAQLWELETIGIMDPVESKSRKEKELAAKEYFQETVSQDEEGRYSVSLPWIEGKQMLPNNRALAEKRLMSTTAKLRACGKYQDYDEIFSGWCKEGIISEVEEDFPSPMSLNVLCDKHYLPHRAVYKPESKTTPVRLVFDASAKTGRYPSLNNCLEEGPNLLELIKAILQRFRIGRIGVISDIRKAFLMIEVKKEDRDYLRFLWWDKEKKLKIFQHNRVVFGMNCSPFLLGAVIKHHLGKVQD